MRAVSLNESECNLWVENCPTHDIKMKSESLKVKTTKDECSNKVVTTFTKILSAQSLLIIVYTL